VEAHKLIRAGSYGEILVELYFQIPSSGTRRPLFPSDRACMFRLLDVFWTLY
jgi:hypothetical protein